jgi:hypothetical protein
MRKFLLTLISCLSVAFLFGQEQNVRICTDENKRILYLSHGLWFNPANDESTKSMPALCNDYIDEFYLNGLKLDEKTFISLQLSPHYLSNDNTTVFNRGSRKQGYGVYEYVYTKSTNCSDKIIFKVNVKLPIFLNGIELNTIENPSGINKIIPSEILSIERKCNLFGVTRIYIKTKNFHD